MWHRPRPSDRPREGSERARARRSTRRATVGLAVGLGAPRRRSIERTGDRDEPAVCRNCLGFPILSVILVHMSSIKPAVTSGNSWAFTFRALPSGSTMLCGTRRIDMRGVREWAREGNRARAPGFVGDHHHEGHSGHWYGPVCGVRLYGTQIAVAQRRTRRPRVCRGWDGGCGSRRSRSRRGSGHVVEREEPAPRALGHGVVRIVVSLGKICRGFHCLGPRAWCARDGPAQGHERRLVNDRIPATGDKV